MAKVQASIARFASKYKNGPGVQLEGKAQAPLKIGEGGEEAATVFKFLNDRADAEALTPCSFRQGKVVMNTTWVYGLVPSAVVLGVNPFGLTAVKLLIMGEVRLILFKFSTLVAAIHTGKLSYDELKSLIANANEATIQQWIAQGASIQAVVQRPYDVVSIPIGWVAAEHSHKGT